MHAEKSSNLSHYERQNITVSFFSAADHGRDLLTRHRLLLERNIVRNSCCLFMKQANITVSIGLLAQRNLSFVLTMKDRSLGLLLMHINMTSFVQLCLALKTLSAIGHAYCLSIKAVVSWLFSTTPVGAVKCCLLENLLKMPVDNHSDGKLLCGVLASVNFPASSNIQAL